MVESSSSTTIESLFYYSQAIVYDSPSSHNFGPKLLIKLQDNNYLIWNQQVERVIRTEIVYKILMNLQISLKFKFEQDWVKGNVSK